MKKLFVFAMVIVLFCSCGIPKERVVTVSNVDISGQLNDYVKVVDATYKFTNDGKNAFITVKFELTTAPDGKLCRKKHPEEIRINAISEAGDVLDTDIYGFETSRTETAKLRDLLNSGKLGDTKSISFTWDYFGSESNKQIASRIFNEATSFEVIDGTFDRCSRLSESTTHWDDLEAVGSSPDTGDDWDQVLNEYEKYVDEYLKFYKKASDGDLSAVTEYMTMLERAESFSKKLSNAEGSMSASQMSRYLKITEKLYSLGDN